MRDFLYRSKWSRADRMMAWTSALIFVGYLGLPTIGKIEGALFPVSTTVEMLTHEPSPPPAHRTVWTAQAHKERSCDYVRIEWFLVQGSQRAIVLADFTDPPMVRPSGLMVWDGLRLWLSPEQIENTVAYVYHQCPWRPWLTRTRFY